MRHLLYRLLYFFGRTPWDSGIVPPEVRAAFEAGDVPPGPCLDLGCGTGTNAVYMAQQGRTVTGVDFVPAAIARAEAHARQAGVAEATRFLVADVTRLPELGLRRCAFALDIGCFHGLSAAGQARYVEGLAATLLPGGRYMLYTLDLRQQAGVAFGLLPAQVAAVFAARFTLRRQERGGFGARGSTWYWMERKE